MMPITRAVVGTSVGSRAALVPLIVYIAPFIARMVEASLLEVSPGVLEAARAMGASNLQIVRRFLLPEAYSSIVLALTTSVVGLLGATAMAGYGGGGGVGAPARTSGREPLNTPLMLFTVVLLGLCAQHL